MYGHHILDCFCFFKVYLNFFNLINYFLKSINNKKLEHMECFFDKIILVSKFENIAYILQN